MDAEWAGTVGVKRVDRLTEQYVRNAPDCLRVAYLMTGDRSAAEDLVQEAFVRAAGRLAHLRNPDAFGHYLLKSVVNLARNHLRRRSVERAYLERRRADPGPNVVAGPDAAPVALRDALMALPERQRAAIVLRFWLDLPQERAAEVLQCPTGTFRSLVSRGMQSLRVAMGDSDE